MAVLECVLGLDLGTSGLKGALLGLDGTVVAVAVAEYAFDSPEPGWAQMDPHVWERAARQVTAELVARAPSAQILAVGLDGQMHGLVLVDAAGEPTAPALLWPDTRAGLEVSRWGALAPELVAGLANPLAAGMAGPMLAWVQGHWPEAYGRTSRFVAAKDWLRSRLVAGELVTDPSDASATLLWDVVADDWHHDLIRELGLGAQLVPPVVPSGSSAGVLGAEVARAWGLPVGIPVTVGCADVAATLVAVESPATPLSLILGSGAQALLGSVAPEATGRPRFHTFRGAGSGYYALGATLNAGLALQQVRTLLGMSWTELYASPYLGLGADDPVFLPYFAGERMPEPIPPGAAGWQGMSTSTTPEVLAAAAVEGMVFGLRRAVEALPPSSGPAQLVGGGGTDPRVRQLLAEVLGRPVVGRTLPNATAIGACLLGAGLLGTEVVLPGEADVIVAQGEVSSEREERYARFTVQSGQATAGKR